MALKGRRAVMAIGILLAVWTAAMSQQLLVWDHTHTWVDCATCSIGAG